MADDTQHNDDPRRPDPEHLRKDPNALREAHSRYGAYLKQVGLPFEPEEFEEQETPPGRGRPAGSASESTGGDDAAVEGESPQAAAPDRPYDESDLPDA